jgi:hypothetical protein
MLAVWWLEGTSCSIDGRDVVDAAPTTETEPHRVLQPVAAVI